MIGVLLMGVPSSCSGVARVLWMIGMLFLGCSEWLLGCCG